MTTPTPDPMREALSEAIEFACSANHIIAGQEPECVDRWRAALAAAPQPADGWRPVGKEILPPYQPAPSPAVREALVELIAKARGHFTPDEMAWAGDGYHDEDRAIADALLADGWRRADQAAAVVAHETASGETQAPLSITDEAQAVPETLAWAVVGEDGAVQTFSILADRVAVEHNRLPGERVVRVAIRVVDDADALALSSDTHHTS